jgi:hypothetical protein
MPGDHRTIADARLELAMVEGNLQEIYDSLDQEGEILRSIKSQPVDLSHRGILTMDMVEFSRAVYQPLIIGWMEQHAEGSEPSMATQHYLTALAACWKLSRVVDSERRINELKQKKKAYKADIRRLKLELNIADSESDSSDSDSDDSDFESEDNDSYSDEGDFVKVSDSDGNFKFVTVKKNPIL